MFEWVIIGVNHATSLELFFVHFLPRAGEQQLHCVFSLFCSRDIQNNGTNGHDPTEDSIATMQLVLLKMKFGLHYGASLSREDWSDCGFLNDNH